ncbi:MAG: hypothetical protein H7195_08635 [Chryseobacterium sp.]|nr:hypothetical protein [Chryseobacterium sp.]
MTTTILSDIFETKLGSIQFSINCENNHEIKKLNDLKIETLNHKIVVEVINLNNLKLPNHMKIDSSIGWRIFIKKTSNNRENLSANCKLLNPSNDTEFSPDCGENLDAIVIEKQTGILHIGTEDGEIMRSRAEKDNWFPVRLKDFVSIENPITEFVDFGFTSQIPNLEITEKLYLHFLVATNYQKSKENEISTWFAVERSKDELDKDKIIGTN